MFVLTRTLIASAEDRAVLLKGYVLKTFLADGWQLIQESPSQLVFERRMEGFGAFTFQAFTTGASGSHPTARFSITFVSETEHITRFYQTLTLTSQNAFGQTTSIPSRNAKDRAYIDAKLKMASAMLPSKYQFRATDDPAQKAGSR